MTNPTSSRVFRHFAPVNNRVAGRVTSSGHEGNTPLWLTMTPDGQTVYTANTADDTISVIDRAAKKERTSIQLPKGKAPKRMLVLTVPVASS